MYFSCGVRPAGGQTQCEAAAVLALWQAPRALAGGIVCCRPSGWRWGPRLCRAQSRCRRSQARRRIKRRRGPRRGRSGRSPQAGTVQGRAAWVPRPMRGPRASSAATRSWRWGSAARCVVRAPSMRCPPGVEIRIDGHALLSAMRYELEKLRCSACGADFYGRVARWRGGREIQPPGPGGAGGEPVLPGRAVLSLARVPGDAGGAGARCDAVGPDRGGG